jgi:hypothetical protein
MWHGVATGATGWRFSGGLRSCVVVPEADDRAEFRCSECKREPREDENADDEWRAVSDGVGELHIFCPECWRREFGAEAHDRVF